MAADADVEVDDQGKLLGVGFSHQDPDSVFSLAGDAARE
jgi:hypothetical protein